MSVLSHIQGGQTGKWDILTLENLFAFFPEFLFFYLSFEIGTYCENLPENVARLARTVLFKYMKTKLGIKTPTKEKKKCQKFWVLI